MTDMKDKEIEAVARAIHASNETGSTWEQVRVKTQFYNQAKAAIAVMPTGLKYKTYERTSLDVDKIYDDFWKELIEVDGEINLSELKKELADFQYLIGEVSKVYCEITGGRMSKIFYPAETVLSEFREVQEKEWDEYLKEEKEAWIDELSEPKIAQNDALVELIKAIRSCDAQGYVIDSKINERCYAVPLPVWKRMIKIFDKIQLDILTGEPNNE